MTTQIFFGSTMLGLCSGLHILILLSAMNTLKHIGKKKWAEPAIVKTGVLIATAFVAVVLAHTIRVWSWAAAFVLCSALTDIEDAMYFSLVTYTTLGYGDMTVAKEYRIFAAMAAVTGLQNFGLSTAFLVALIDRLFNTPK